MSFQHLMTDHQLSDMIVCHYTTSVLLQECISSWEIKDLTSKAREGTFFNIHSFVSRPATQDFGIQSWQITLITQIKSSLTKYALIVGLL